MPKTTPRSPHSPSKTGSSSPSKPIYLARFGFSRTKRSSTAAATGGCGTTTTTGDDSNVVEECASPPKRQRHSLGPEAVQTGKENGGRSTTTGAAAATSSGGASSSTSTGAAGTSSGGAKSSTVANGNGAMTSGGNKRAPLLDLTQDCSSSSDSSDRVAGSSSAAKRMGTSATEATHQQSLKQRRGKRDKSIGGLSCSRESLGSSEAPIAIHDDEEVVVVVVNERSESIARGAAGVVRSNYNAADKTSGNGSGGGDSEKSNRWRGSRQSKKQTPLLQTSGGSIQSYFSPSKEGGFAKR